MAQLRTMLRKWILLSRARECPPHMSALRDRLRHHFDFPKELHFPKPCSFLSLFAGPSLLFPQDPFADICWPILEHDVSASQRSRKPTAMQLKSSPDRGDGIHSTSPFTIRILHLLLRHRI